MIAIVDYGVGNLRSVHKAFNVFDESVIVTQNRLDLEKSDKIVIPGVGAFSKAIENLSNLKIIDSLREQVLIKKKPFLGICVGMQILADKGLEHGEHQGLGWIPGEVRTLRGLASGLPVPNVGWCPLEHNDTVMFRNIENGASAYFVHSFYFNVLDSSNIAAKVKYGDYYPAALVHENIWATQFHPEKSQKVGLQILRNFVNLS